MTAAMRLHWLVSIACALLLQACSAGALLPGGCEDFAQPDSRKLACSINPLHQQAQPQDRETQAAIERQCRRTLGGTVECYAPPR